MDPGWVPANDEADDCVSGDGEFMPPTVPDTSAADRRKAAQNGPRIAHLWNSTGLWNYEAYRRSEPDPQVRVQFRRYEPVPRIRARTDAPSSRE